MKVLLHFNGVAYISCECSCFFFPADCDVKVSLASINETDELICCLMSLILLLLLALKNFNLTNEKCCACDSQSMAVDDPDYWSVVFLQVQYITLILDFMNLTL